MPGIIDDFVTAEVALVSADYCAVQHQDDLLAYARTETVLPTAMALTL